MFNNYSKWSQIPMTACFSQPNPPFPCGLVLEAKNIHEWHRLLSHLSYEAIKQNYWFPGIFSLVDFCESVSVRHYDLAMFLHNPQTLFSEGDAVLEGTKKKNDYKQNISKLFS